MISNEVIKIIDEIVVPVGGAVIISIVLAIKNEFKKFATSHKSYIDLQTARIQNTIGKDQYDKDVAVINQAINNIKAMTANFSFADGLNILAQFTGKTSLDDNEIIKIIKQALNVK